MFVSIPLKTRFPNVVHHRLGNEWGKLLYSSYLIQFFEGLRNFDSRKFEGLRFLVVEHNTKYGKLELPIEGPDTVLIWSGDEMATIPKDLKDRYRLILKGYWPVAKSLGNLHPFPLCGCSEVVDGSPRPFADRGLNVFFSGNLNANRVDFHRQFTWMRAFPPLDLPTYFLRRTYWEMLRRLTPRNVFSERFPDSLLQFTGGFMQGLDPVSYSQILANSRIAICPPGFASSETIRHFEAMRMGCVIVSPPMPPNIFYHGSPIVELESWRETESVLRRLLKDRSALEERAAATERWWHEHCSPAALAMSTAVALRFC